MKFVRAALVVTLALMVSSMIWAQGTGGLSIQVTDAEGSPLPTARVTLSHNAGNISPFTVVADKDGWARFPVLRPGSGYILEVEFPGFGKRHEENITVSISKDKDILIQLSSEMTERVRVVAESTVVDLEKSSSSVTFSDEFVQDLPVPGRFYQNVLTLAPGVMDSDGDGNPTVHGSRSRDFKAVVGGVSNVDPLTGKYMSLVNADSIEEMEVITGGAGVEFGRAQGGFARIIQKQGTNEFEGTFSFLFRSSILDGTGANDFSNLPDPEFDEFHPSIQISGPLVKDKLWYRFSHEQLDREDPINITSGIEVQTQKQGIHSDQLTYQVSPRNKLSLQYQFDPLSIDNLGISSLTPHESTLTQDTESETLSMIWTAPFSPKLLFQTTLAYQDLNSKFLPTTSGLTNACVSGNPFLENAQCRDLNTGEVSGSNGLSVNTNSQRLTLSTQGTIFGGQFWGANHQFKLGFAIENERYVQEQIVQPSIATFQTATLGTGTPQVVTIVAAQISIPIVGTRCNGYEGTGSCSNLRSTGSNWNFYLEDTIKPFNNLVITLGVRVDREEIDANGLTEVDVHAEQLDLFERLADPGETDTIDWTKAFTAFEGIADFIDVLSDSTGLDPDTIEANLSNITRQAAFWEKSRANQDIHIKNTNIAPSINVSWDPWSDGKTKFAFSARRFYDKIVLAIPLLEVNPATTTLLFNTSEQNGALVTTGLRSNINPAVNIFSVDHDLATPYQDEIRFVFERELFTETSIKFEYLNRKYRGQHQTVDINHAPGDFGKCKLAVEGSPLARAPIEESPGSGQIVTDPFTGQTYIDIDPGVGDGRTDDCAGRNFAPTGQGETDAFNPAVNLQRPDGFSDLYVQNPSFGRIDYLGNVNSADYEGFVLELTRRQYRSWEMTGSYTWSIARGNGEDFNQFIGLDQSLIDREFGFQSNDQRHVVKAIASTITPWGFRLGSVIQWQSGLPWSVLLAKFSFDQAPEAYSGLGSYNPSRQRWTYPTGTRNDQRNSSYWTMDLKLTKEMNLSRGMNLQMSAEVFNLFNEGTYQVYIPGQEMGYQLNGANNARNLFGRSWQLGMKLAF